MVNTAARLAVGISEAEGRAKEVVAKDEGKVAAAVEKMAVCSVANPVADLDVATGLDVAVAKEEPREGA